jgi:hypothetical protein
MSAKVFNKWCYCSNYQSTSLPRINLPGVQVSNTKGILNGILMGKSSRFLFNIKIKCSVVNAQDHQSAGGEKGIDAPRQHMKV